MSIGIILIAVLIGAAGSYLLLKPQLKRVKSENGQIALENHKLLQQKRQLREQINLDLAQEKNCIEKIELLKTHIKDLEASSEEAATVFYKKNMALAENRFSADLEEKEKQFQQAIESFNNNLADTMSDGVLSFENIIASKKDELLALTNQISDLQLIADAAVEAAKRAEEIKESSNFYRIHLEGWEREEIDLLRNAGKSLKNIEPLNKVIWKCYYEKPTTDLIGRVIGSGAHCGIYKITNIESQKCYIGQAVNLSERWKQHIKRGVGAEAPTRNKLYPAMYEVGPENFTFEVLEECDKALLDSREDYWQDFYKAKEFGYSIK